MTDIEMDIIRNAFFELGETLVLWDDRTDDKKLLLITQDEPTHLRYIINSPIFTDWEKQKAEYVLDQIHAPRDAEENEGLILYRAPEETAHADPQGVMQ